MSPPTSLQPTQPYLSLTPSLWPLTPSVLLHRQRQIAIGILFQQQSLLDQSLGGHGDGPHVVHSGAIALLHRWARIAAITPLIGGLRKGRVAAVEAGQVLLGAPWQP
jgi:hypothetical protein